MRLASLLTIAALLGACTPAAPAGNASEGADDTRPSSGDTVPTNTAAGPDTAAESDSARLVRLEREARALARADGCPASAQCRTAPVGSRPCGGPREYVVYCAATTDSAALFARLAELARAEDAYNQARGLASTCEYRMPPQTELSGGTCRASAVPSPVDAPQ